MAVRSHLVLPMPDKRVAPGRLRLPEESHEALVDSRTGVVRRLTDVRHVSRAPASLKTVRATLCDLSRVSRWRVDPVAGGSVFDDRASARRAAVGEAVERYCGNIVQPHLLHRASYGEMVRAGERAVDPGSLVLKQACPGPDAVVYLL